MHRCVPTLLLAIVTFFESRADHCCCFFLKKHTIHEIVEHTVPRKVNLQDNFVSDWPDMSKVFFFLPIPGA